MSEICDCDKMKRDPVQELARKRTLLLFIGTERMQLLKEHRILKAPSPKKTPQPLDRRDHIYYRHV